MISAKQITDSFNLLVFDKNYCNFCDDKIILEHLTVCCKNKCFSYTDVYVPSLSLSYSDQQFCIRYHTGIHRITIYDMKTNDLIFRVNSDSELFNYIISNMVNYKDIYNKITKLLILK